MKLARSDVIVVMKTALNLIRIRGKRKALFAVRL